MGFFDSISKGAKAGHKAGIKYAAEKEAKGEKSSAGEAALRGAGAALKAQGPELIKSLFKLTKF